MKQGFLFPPLASESGPAGTAGPWRCPSSLSHVLLTEVYEGESLKPTGNCISTVSQQLSIFVDTTPKLSKWRVLEGYLQRSI